MKTEKPTPRRLLKEARRGRVYHSRDVAAWLALAGGTLVMTQWLTLEPLTELYGTLIEHRFAIPLA